FKRVIKEKICYSKLFLFGDFDSISTTHLKKSKNDKNIEVTILPKEKNLSDFACILDHIQSHFSHQQLYIEIYGGLGNARDHEMANIQEVEHLLNKSKEGGIAVFQGNVIL